MKTIKLYTWLFFTLFILCAWVLSSCKLEIAATPDNISARADGEIAGITDPCATCADQALYKTVGNDSQVIGNVAVCQTLTQLTLTFTVSGDRENAWFNQTGIAIDPNGVGFTTLNPSYLTRDHGDKVRSYTWTILFSDPIFTKSGGTQVVPGDLICVAAYAVVPGADGAGGQVWAGTTITTTGNPAPRYFCYQIKACSTPPCPTSDCFFSQGYWFAKPSGSQWPSETKTIVFGGYEYSYSDARSIFFSPNKKGKTDAKQAFLQGLAMKLNLAGGADPDACTGGAAALFAIEDYFDNLQKQSVETINLHSANSSLRSAASLLSNCIKADPCDNTVIQ